jgi:IMP dehydrogenase
MTQETLITVPVGTTLDQARENPAPGQGREAPGRRQGLQAQGLITVKDIQKAIKYPNACKDSLGRLRCGAAVGIARDTLERATRSSTRTSTCSSSTPRTATRRA